MLYAGRSPLADMVLLCHDLGSCSWDVDHAGSVVTRHSAKEQDVSDKTLEDARGTWGMFRHELRHGLLIARGHLRGPPGGRGAVPGLA